MRRVDVDKYRLPDAPGVYYFLNNKKEIIYIGKATSLRDRVRSYFTTALAGARGPGIAKMVKEASAIDYRKTDSVLEALILEAALIKTYKPTYNSREKDDKSYNYVVITKENWPRILVVRGKDLDQRFAMGELKRVFGPFPHGLQLKEAMKIIRSIFPHYDTPRPVAEMTSKQQAGKVRFNQTLGLYPNAQTSIKEYARTIRYIELFFDAKKPQLLKQLEQDMRRFAKEEAFEKANRVKRQLFALQHINDVTLLKREIRDITRKGGAFRIEAYDIAHISGKNMSGVMTVVEDAEVKKSDYRKFSIRGVLGPNDTAALKEVLRRRFAHDEWRLPNLIVVDGGKAQLNAARVVLEEFGYQISLVAVVKNERHKPREILGDPKITREHEVSIILANSEAHRFSVDYHRKRRGKL